MGTCNEPLHIYCMVHVLYIMFTLISNFIYLKSHNKQQNVAVEFLIC